MKELIAYIEAENAKTQAWVNEDPKNRWAGMTTTDPEHWKNYGITTVDQYRHYMLVAEYSDAFKSFNGFRPRWMNFNEMSIEELEQALDTLYKGEQRRQEQDQKEIADLCKELSCTEDDLKRWDVI